MDRVKRRWWTLVTIAAAGVVIVASLVSGLFQAAVYLLPNYRDDLSVWVTRVADRPVQIGGISLVWSGASPRLDLADIVLYDEDGNQGLLSAQRLSLGISLWRLLRGDWSPTSLELSGLSLTLRLDEQGRLSLAGFDNAEEFSGEDAEKWLRQLDRFRDLSLENCELALEWPDRTLLRFGLTRFEASRSLAGFDAEATLRLPPTHGEELRFETEIEGDITAPALWQGELSASASGLQPQPWLRGWVAPGTAAGVDSMEAQLEGRVEGGRVSALTLALTAENLAIARAGDEQNLEALRAEVQLGRVSGGWRLELTQLQLDGEDELQGKLHYLPLDPGFFEMGANVQYLRLDRLLPYLRYARDLPPPARSLAGVRGILRQLQGRLRRDAAGERYNAQVELDNLALDASGGAYGFGQLNGRVATTEAGGRLLLTPGPLQLRLPALLTPELPLAWASGALAWSRDEAGWRLAMPQFGWRLAGSNGSGQFELRLPAAAAQSPFLDLAANFSVADAAALKPWMPRQWGQGLQQWLQRGVLAARVPRAQLQLRGPLRDFPYAAGGGEWKLSADVADARVDYAQGWPPLEQLQAQLAFRGNSLNISSSSARLAGSLVEEINAEFADFGNHLLTVDAAVRGETADFYRLLDDSPLAATLAPLLRNTRAAGPARVGLRLDIPLVRGAEVAASGSVALDGVQMFYADLREPFSDIRGTLAFDNNGVTADSLQAHFADVDLAARVEAREGTHGVVVAEFLYALNAAGEGLSAYVPELVRRHAGGSAQYRAELALGGEPAGLAIASDLKGTELRLPLPLAKAAGDGAPLRVHIGADAEAPLRVRVDYETRLAADLAFTRPAAGAAQLRGVNLRLGAGAPPPPATTDLRVSGQLAELDLGAWGGALGAFKAGDGGLPLREADISAARWLFRGQLLREARARYTPLPEGWDLRLDGAGAEGTASWRRATDAAGGGSLSAQLTHFRLEAPQLLETGAPGEKPAAAAAEAAQDPNAWPVLDLDVARFDFNGTDFGALRLSSARVPERGQKIESLKLSGGALDASASGEWQRRAGQSSASFSFEAGSGDFTAVLKSLGFAESLAADQAEIKGDLRWEPAAAGLDWTQARGRIALGFENGTLKAVEPGAGRVLGLLNFYALPRRLTLDFRDVVSAGLGFDRIDGHFDLGGGSALTDDLSIKAPSLRMELRGRVGLAARDYEQRVTIYPDVTPGVTLGAALLGGPAFAAIAFIAQQVLDKPLDQVTQLSYQVTGSWENPQVKRVDATAPEPAAVTRPRN